MLTEDPTTTLTTTTTTTTTTLPHNRDFVSNAASNKSVFDGGDSSIHHIRRRHNLSSGFGIRQGNFGDSLTTDNKFRKSFNKTKNRNIAWIVSFNNTYLLGVSMDPSSFKIPQCPWSVYGHKQTSTISNSRGNFSLRRGRTLTTGFSALSACVPLPSLERLAGTPKMRIDLRWRSSTRGRRCRSRETTPNRFTPGIFYLTFYHFVQEIYFNF